MGGVLFFVSHYDVRYGRPTAPTMSRLGSYFGTGKRHAEEEALISDDDERSAADVAGMQASSGPYYGAASDVATEEGHGEDDDVLRSEREIVRKLRESESGGIGYSMSSSSSSSSTARRRGGVDVKVWAVRSLAVVLAVAMIFVVSVSKPGRNAAADVGVAVGGPNSEPPPSTAGGWEHLQRPDGPHAPWPEHAAAATAAPPPPPPAGPPL